MSEHEQLMAEIKALRELVQKLEERIAAQPQIVIQPQPYPVYPLPAQPVWPYQPWYNTCGGSISAHAPNLISMNS